VAGLVGEAAVSFSGLGYFAGLSDFLSEDLPFGFFDFSSSRAIVFSNSAGSTGFEMCALKPASSAMRVSFCET